MSNLDELNIQDVIIGDSKTKKEISEAFILITKLIKELKEKTDKTVKDIKDEIKDTKEKQETISPKLEHKLSELESTILQKDSSKAVSQLKDLYNELSFELSYFKSQIPPDFGAELLTLKADIESIVIPEAIEKTPDELITALNKSNLKLRPTLIDGLQDIERIAKANQVAVPVTTTNFYSSGSLVGRAKNINITGSGAPTLSVTGDSANLSFSASAGSGDVTGPGSATDNDIALFNGATGKIIKDSGHTLSEYALLASSPTFQDSSGQHTWFTIKAPSGDPQEATMTTMLDLGSGNKEFIDWTIENYGTDHIGSLNIAKSGTGTLLPFSIRYWNQDLGNIATFGVKVMTFLSNGNVGIGASGAGVTPTEILHIFKSTGNFTTIRYDSGTTQGYFFAYDGDNSVNIGSNSASTVNFKVGNSTKASLDSSGNMTATTFTGAHAGNATTATTLQTARSIYGNNFDGSAALAQIIASTFGGTGNGFTKFSGPTTAEKTFTLPDASSTIVVQGGALGTPSSGTLTNASGLPIAGLVASTSTAIGVGSIELGNASDTTITRTGAGAIAVEGTAVLLSGGALGTPSSGTLTNATGLPVAGITSSTSTALGVGSLELGNASDTTLTRVSGGVMAVEGHQVAVLDTAQTFTATQTQKQEVFTNNAITASSNAATVPITSKLNTVTNNSAATLTITMTTTSAVDGQTAIVRILDSSAVAQTITWVNTENSTVSAPTTSNGSTTLFLTVGFIYNGGTSKWRCIASA